MSLLPAGFVESQFDTGELSLNYVRGPANGPPLVLIPGQSMPWQSYGRVLPLLAPHFEVFAVDVRGHGRSSHTPGKYTFSAMSRDVAALLRGVVKRPAIVSGNSSGGVIAVWLAANAPEHVSGIVPEDPPLFASEWPWMRDHNWAHKLFTHVAATLQPTRDFRKFFEGFEIPVERGQRVMKFPRLLAGVLGAAVAYRQRKHPGEPVELGWLPFQLRVWVKSLSEYDVGFTAAFADGSACDFDHGEALSRVRCPALLLHADWFTHERLGLVGAINDEQVAQVRARVPQLEYFRVRGGHVIHMEKPKLFVQLLRRFAAEVSPAHPERSAAGA